MKENKASKGKISLTLIALTAVLLAYSLYARSNGDLSAANLKTMIDTGNPSYLLVDVRTPGEYAGGFIPTAINIPLQQIADTPPDAAKDSLVIVYCRSGNRSSQAARLLEEIGYTNIVDFGGISRWTYDKDYP